MYINAYNNYKNTNFSFGAKAPKIAMEIPKEQVQNYLEQGKSINELAHMYNVSVSYFYKVLNNLDIKSPRKINRHKIDNSFKHLENNLKTLVKSGASIEEMHRQTGLSKYEISRWIEENMHKPLRYLRHDLRTDLIKKGASDEEIAKALGVKPNSARGMRYAADVRDVKSKEDKKNMILERMQKGLYPKEAARELGMSVCTVYQYVRKYKLKDALKEFIKNKIIEMAKQDKNITEMSQELRISRQSVRSYIEEFNLKELVDKYKKQLSDSIIKRYENGQKPKDIAKELGLPKYKISYILRKSDK